MTVKVTAMLPSPSETGSARLIVLGNPENRRVQLFAEAAASFGSVEAVAWLDFLRDANSLARRLTPDSILRIESPGENFAVERALLLRGTQDTEGYSSLSGDEIATLKAQRGRIWPMRQWFRGWQLALAEVESLLVAMPGCRVMSSPAEITTMFDKARCQEIFRVRGVPVAPLLGMPGSFSELREMMFARGCRRAFLKPCHSSSASGVVALEVSGNALQAFTSVELVQIDGRVQLFNSLQVRRYSELREISLLIDALCQERCLAEMWLPKAGLDGQRLDLRVLVIAGCAAHVVVRQSSGPMTNLHLGNRRGDPDRLRVRMGEENWCGAMAVCERAAAAFPRSLHVAVDLLVSPSFGRFAVAEVNAFGDLLPRVFHQGLNTYAAELAAFFGSREPLQVSTIGL
jgi:hypothetical protein